MSEPLTAAAYPRPDLKTPSSARLESLMHAYYGLGSVFLATMGVAATLVLAYGLASDREFFSGYLALSAILVPPGVAAVLSCSSTRHIAHGMGWKPFVGIFISFFIGLAMFGLEFYGTLLAPIGKPTSHAELLLYTSLFAAEGLLVLPIVRLFVSLAIRKAGVKPGLRPITRKKIVARIEELSRGNGLQGLGPVAATVSDEDRIIRLSP